MIGIVMFFCGALCATARVSRRVHIRRYCSYFWCLGRGHGHVCFMPYRIQSIMENTVLMAVPLFVFMGLVLQKTKLAEQLLESMGRLFGGVRGGIAISTVLVGALLAASTGVVGASVVAMG